MGHALERHPDAAVGRSVGLAPDVPEPAWLVLLMRSKKAGFRAAPCIPDAGRFAARSCAAVECAARARSMPAVWLRLELKALPAVALRWPQVELLPQQAEPAAGLAGAALPESLEAPKLQPGAA